MQRRRETGETSPQPAPPRVAKLTPHLNRLRALVEEKADRTLIGLRALLDVDCCLATFTTNRGGRG
ncbi:hypothetical protein LzC2_23180 [Planctomycetes bacterium LzC2]|uniref:Transposase n=1 Tax=Alienimonas chondri TaxID=2681879 RepID=A0ABX1VG45_9PLAN|nr:hypothetical protein [Alienimonas chondri]NNJ26237.1 hypothetical protein [Alienimonas chondri]